METEELTYGFFPGCAYKTAAGYMDSVDAVNRVLGIVLEEVSDWNCCGATAIFSLNQLDALTLNGRLIALANKQGFDQIVTICNACYTTLRKANRIFGENQDNISRINEKLAQENLEITTLLPVRHYLEILCYDIAEDVWSGKRPDYIDKLKVAAYYGCQLTRPWGDLDQTERPKILDQLLEKLGFQVIDHSAKTFCCGAAHFLPYEKDCQPLIRRILDEAKRKGAQLISTLCPLCQFNLDAAQAKLTRSPIPIPYFSQLAGLALGISPKELGLQKLLAPMKDLLEHK
jgi:heterodisulfide reductase subunit B